jgi:hypothetical protein
VKYIEVGIGNTWLVRTETELEDGTEYEEKGVKGPLHFKSVYVRLWIGRKVLIWDLKEGYKRVEKSRRKFKVIIGIVSL